MQTPETGGKQGNGMPLVRIGASRFVRLNVRDVWAYRELLYFLIWRDVKVRYKQTVMGVAWVVLQPLLMMVLFSIVFGRLAKLPSDGVPYPLFTYAGLLPWQYFAAAVVEASNSLITNERLVTKVYFPRLILPLAAVLGGLVDFAVSFCVLLLLMARYRFVPSVWILALPAFLAFAVCTAFAVGLWLSALNVRYRDVRYTLQFLIQFWMFATPVVYSASLVPARWRALYGLNPMVGVIEGFRWVLLGKVPDISAMIFVSAGAVILCLFAGLVFFRRTERTLADII